jgi:hypothetical protein
MHVNEPWWRSSGRLLVWVFTRVWMPLVALAAPALVIYGAFAPYGADAAALGLSGRDVALLIGVSGSGEPRVVSQRLYIVPSRLIRNGSITVVDDDGARILTVDRPIDGALIVLTWMVCVVGSWLIVVRPLL